MLHRVIYPLTFTQVHFWHCTTLLSGCLKKQQQRTDMDNYYHPILCRLKDISTCPAEYSLPASLAAKYERKSESESRSVVSECFVTPGTIAVREAAKCAYVSNFCLVKYKQSVYTVLSANVLTKECMFSPFIHTASWW